MTGRLRLAAAAVAALMAMSLAGPALAETTPAPDPAVPSAAAPAEPVPAAEPSTTVDSTSSPGTATEWIDCTDPADCPAAPTITSVTATVDSLTVAWEWPGSETVPEGVTSVVVRVAPGDLETVVSSADTTALIAGLDAGTDYSLALFAAAGQQLSPSSEIWIESTVALVDTGSDIVDEATMKPLATPGEVDSLIVTFKDDTNTEVQAEQASDDLPVAGVAVDDAKDLGAGTAVLELDTDISDADAALIIDDLEQDSRVASVERNGRFHRTAFPVDPPDDTYWSSGSLWGLYGTFGTGIASSKTSMNNVWTSTASSQGSGAVVAVLDTGSTVHPDLDANYVAGYDFVSSDTTPTCRSGATNADGDYVSPGTYGPAGWDAIPLDPGDWTTVTSSYCGYAGNSSWHGTHVAGTIAAVANNAAGVVGVAPQAKIQPVRVLGVEGGTYDDIIAGINWAVGETVGSVPVNATPANVVNMSLGGSGSCPAGIQTAITNAVNNGVVVVVSAGNATDDAANYSPANCTGVITVAASTSAGTLASYSNYGSTVEITAPGSGIWSTVNSGATVAVGPSYNSYSGTSMAAPHVSGVAALLLAANPSLTPAQVLTTMESNALGFPTTGSWYDCTTAICGAGLLRAAPTTTPVVFSVSDSTGPIAGGESVTLTGINMANVTSVTFGGAVGTIGAQTATSLTVTAPGHASGAVDIVLTNPAGTGTATDAYRYFDPPTASGLSVSTGTTAGSTSVVITGTDLAPADIQDSQWVSVSFGGTAGTVWLPGTTSITVTTPAHAAGVVDVVVTTPGGSSTLSGAFTFVAPSSPPPPAPPAASTPSSSSSESDAGGGGGGLNEITTIAPTNSGAPGSVIALAGWGLSTTRGVYFNDSPAASWRVVTDSHVEVVVPDIPPGVYVIHDVLAPEVGRASYWTGFHVLPKSASAPVAGTPPSLGATPGTSPGAPATSSAGDLVGFRPNSAVLSASTKTKLARLVNKVGDGDATGTVLVFSDKRGTAESKKVAKARAKNIINYLRTQGVDGDITTIVEKGDTSTLRKSSVVRLSTDPGASTVSTNERVDSLIVRYDKGVSPTVNGTVRGSSYVTGGLGTGMTLGPNLGLRMYRVDFASPVTLAQAEKAATQMMTDKGIQFAEPDRIVRANVSIN